MPKRTYKTAVELGISDFAYKYLKEALEVLPRLDEPADIMGKKFGFNMSYEYIENSDLEEGKKVFDHSQHNCGTAGCILGLMRILSNTPLIIYTSKNGYTSKNDGLTRDDWERLYTMFYPPSSLVQYKKVTNRDAIKVVDQFLQTGIIDTNFYIHD